MRLSLRRPSVGTLVALAVSAGFAPGLLAQAEDVVPPDRFALHGTYYRQDDDGGNPFLDEDASIVETVLLVDKHIGARDALHVRLLADVISAASYDAVQDAGALTGASGENPGRLGASLGWSHTYDDDLSVTLDGSFANEYAYRSRGASALFTRSFLEDNVRLGLHLQSYRDIVRVVRFDGVDEGQEDRNTFSTRVSWTQVLSRLALLHLDVFYGYQRGFLATSFNAVQAGGVREFERVPDTRNRQSATLRYKHAVFAEDAVELSYRFYDDTWGIDAHTLELRYSHALDGQRVILQPSYRYYTQSEADFFGVSFPATRPLQSSDPDLGDFDGHMIALQVFWFDVDMFGQPCDYNLGASIYDRSDDLDLTWVNFGLSLAF